MRLLHPSACALQKDKTIVYSKYQFKIQLSTQVDMSPPFHIVMDCNTCETAPSVVINKPEVVEVVLTITEKAKEMLSSAFGDDRSHALLVGVLSGGCSGYMYDLQIVESTEQDCQEINLDGFRVLVPNATSHLLDGIEIDYVDRMMGGGFKINNPNAESSCGCGESFA